MRILIGIAALACACALAQDEVVRERPRYEAPDADLDSTGLRVIALDAVDSTPVRALVCFSSGLDTSATANTDGVATIHVRGGGNIRAWVRARGYAEQFLIFNPGRPGRMQVRVAMTRDAKREAEPTCDNLGASQ